MVIIDPTVQVEEPLASKLSPRLASLSNKAVGVLWNEKPNGDILLARLETRLREDFGVSTQIRLTKSPAAPARQEVLDALAEKVDFVISGVCD